MKFKNILLGIGIVVVFALALWQGIEAFYPSPTYDDYCKGLYSTYPTPVKPYQEPYSNCTFSRPLQQESDECTFDGGTAIYDYDDNGCIISIKECNYCNQEFNEADKSHSSKVFFISLIVGILALIIGYSILSVEPVGSALIGSGIWSLFFGSVINWRNFSNIWRFLLLIIALILLIWFALRLNKEEKKGFLRKLFRK